MEVTTHSTRVHFTILDCVFDDMRARLRRLHQIDTMTVYFWPKALGPLCPTTIVYRSLGLQLIFVHRKIDAFQYPCTRFANKIERQCTVE